jgi:hypothetical protein
MSAPISTINLSGKLTTLSYEPYPSNEFSNGLWNMSFYEIVVNSMTFQGDYAVGISCNFVKNLKYNENHQVESCNPILATFVVKPNTIVKYSFDSSWTLINSVEEYMKVYFIDLETKKNLDKEVKIHLLIRFQRIK